MSKITKDKHGHDVTHVELRYAKNSHIEWYVRTHLEQTDMDAGLGKKAYMARLEQINRGDKLPRTIPVLADLVMSEKDAEEFDFAPEDEREWPCGSEYPEDGFDEAGNEYWMLIKFNGDNPEAPGARNPTSTSGKTVGNRFSINGMELLLHKGQMACVHGRYVRHIRTLTAYQFAEARPKQEMYGPAVPETPKDEEGRAQLEEYPRYFMDILGCAGPVQRVEEDGKVTLLLPARKKLIDRGMIFDVQKFKGALRQLKRVEQSHKRLTEEAAMKQAAELYGQKLAQDEMERRALVVRDRILNSEATT